VTLVCQFPWLNDGGWRVSSENLLGHGLRGNDFLEDGEHSFHFRLSANTDAHTAITIRTIAQGNPLPAHAVENGAAQLSKICQQKIRMTGPALESHFFQGSPQPLTGGAHLSDVVFDKFAVIQGFCQALDRKCIDIEGRSYAS